MTNVIKGIILKWITCFTSLKVYIPLEDEEPNIIDGTSFIRLNLRNPTHYHGAISPTEVNFCSRYSLTFMLVGGLLPLESPFKCLMSQLSLVMNVLCYLLCRVKPEHSYCSWYLSSSLINFMFNRLKYFSEFIFNRGI